MASNRTEKMAASLGKMPKAAERSDITTRAFQSPLKELITGDSVLIYENIPLDELEYHPGNSYRVDDTENSLVQLANEIDRAEGLYHNIVVSEREDGKKVILSGERRHRSYVILREKYNDSSDLELQRRFKTIYSQVRKGLSERQELIILDSANLQARGAGAASEQRYRKSMIRFIENVKAEYGLSDDEILEMVAAMSEISPKTISRNFEIEMRLHPELRNLLDSNKISKDFCLKILHLAEDEQIHIASTLAKTTKKKTIEDYCNRVVLQLDMGKPVEQVFLLEENILASPLQAERRKITTVIDKAEAAVNSLLKKSEIITKLDRGSADSTEETLSKRINLLMLQLEKLQGMLNE